MPYCSYLLYKAYVSAICSAVPIGGATGVLAPATKFDGATFSETKVLILFLFFIFFSQFNNILQECNWKINKSMF